MSGAAPGAQLVSVRVCLFVAGCTAHALVEGMIYAAKDANVDVINMSIGGLPSLNDGNNARAVLYDRLIEQYKVQMFISAGNSGPGENTVGDPSVATKVMSIGTYITDATWESNYGSTAPAAGTDNQHPFSSRGPREDGGFKPNVIAPGAAISSTPMWQPGGPVAGTYTLPPGYSMLNGTSMASPQAAGVGALLVSAAEAGRRPAPAGPAAPGAQLLGPVHRRLRGVRAGQRPHRRRGRLGAPGDEQRQDRRHHRRRSPVNTALSAFLATPNVGVGIHDREGVIAGQSYTRTYTFTAHNGRRRDQDLQPVVGRQRRHVLQRVVDRTAVEQPGNADRHDQSDGLGVHSAILNLDDPSSPGIEYQTLNTVIVPYAFTAGGNFQHVITDSVARNQAFHYFFRVPAGTPAFKVDFSRPERDAGDRPGPLPALPPVRREHRRATRASSATRRRCRWPAPAAARTAERRPTRRPASGRSPSKRGGRPTRSSRRSR